LGALIAEHVDFFFCCHFLILLVGSNLTL
jgi:hypothetical protein